jgi:phenylalanyl-tRNA synthetase beta chain
VFLSAKKVRNLTGAPFSNEQILHALELLEIEVANHDGHMLELNVPPYRSDVTRDVDVIEDILRIYGYNQVPLSSALSPCESGSFYRRKLPKTARITNAYLEETL